MSGDVTVYNDGHVDLQVVRLNTRSGRAFEHKLLPSSGPEPAESHAFRLNNDELLIVTTAEGTKAEPADGGEPRLIPDRLIAAAPELLAALRAFHDAATAWHKFHDHPGTGINCDAICRCIPVAAAAIAKAEEPA